MPAKPRILVVDDDPIGVIFLVDVLEHMQYEVIVARNGLDGLRKARTEQPSLIILDIILPGVDGYEVCRQLRADLETRSTPILMLTARGQLQDRVKGYRTGADDFLAKPYNKDEFEERVKTLLKRVPLRPFPMTAPGAAFCISYSPYQRLNLRVSGVTTLNMTTQETVLIDVDKFSRRAENTYQRDWRFNSKDYGELLYWQLFVKPSQVLANYKEVLGEVQDDTRLHVCFETDRNGLRIPFEFLYDNLSGMQEYLVLRHPLARSIEGVRRKQALLSPDFFNELAAQGQDLKILLIGSDTQPSIPHVDAEIRSLDRSLKSMFESKGISCQVETICTEQASYENVRNLLRRCEYHIIHYAGHGSYDVNSPENSSLFFWESQNRSGAVKRMPTSELKILLRGSQVRLAYLSCCVGTKTGAPDRLLDDDFLGIADGMIQSGVPAVLGFRWPVDDKGAETLAQAFYASLTKQGQIDQALLDARCEVAAQNRDDITWLSPILIMQA